MSNISKTSKALKKKLSFDDYEQPASTQDSKTVQPHADKKAKQQDNKLVSGHRVMPVKQQAVIPVSTHSSRLVPVKQQASKPTRKYKATFYLDEEAHNALTQVYIKGLQANQKVDKSALICKAIRLLYKQEI